MNPENVQPGVVGFHCDVDAEKGHRFEPSIAFPGSDACGRVAGWMTACGQPKSADIHKRGYEKRRQLLREAVAKPGAVAKVELTGSVQTECRLCGGRVDAAPGDDPICINCWLGTGGQPAMLRDANRRDAAIGN